MPIASLSASQYSPTLFDSTCTLSLFPPSQCVHLPQPFQFRRPLHVSVHALLPFTVVFWDCIISLSLLLSCTHVQLQIWCTIVTAVKCSVCIVIGHLMPRDFLQLSTQHNIMSLRGRGKAFKVSKNQTARLPQQVHVNTCRSRPRCDHPTFTGSAWRWARSSLIFKYRVIQDLEGSARLQAHEAPALWMWTWTVIFGVTEFSTLRGKCWDAWG